MPARPARPTPASRPRRGVSALRSCVTGDPPGTDRVTVWLPIISTGSAGQTFSNRAVRNRLLRAPPVTCAARHTPTQAAARSGQARAAERKETGVTPKGNHVFERRDTTAGYGEALVTGQRAGPSWPGERRCVGDVPPRGRGAHTGGPGGRPGQQRAGPSWPGERRCVGDVPPRGRGAHSGVPGGRPPGQHSEPGPRGPASAGVSAMYPHAGAKRTGGFRGVVPPGQHSAFGGFRGGAPPGY